MTRNAPRRQHFIPRMLLKNFCDASGLLWVSHESRAYRSKPRKVFVQRDLYTKYDLSPRHDTSLEEWFDSIPRSYEHEAYLSIVESKATPAVRQIIRQARKKRCPQLPGDLRDAWERFLFAIARRTPESQARVSLGKGFDDIFYDVSAELAHKQDFPLADKATLYRDPRVRELRDMVKTNNDGRLAAGVDPRVVGEEAKLLRETGLHVVVICIPGKEFVLGSHGIAIVEDDHGSPSGSWLPIAPDIAVGVTDRPDREALSFLDHDDDGVRIVDMINKASAGRSWMIAGRSEAVIRSVMNQVLRRKTP